MEAIDRRDLDLSSFERISEGEEGVVYRDGDLAFKFFKNENLKILNNKEEKIDILSNLNIDNVVKPLVKVLDKNKLCGYAMKYIDANNLFMMTKFNKMYNDNVYLDIFYIQIEYISKLLKEIHSSKYKLVVGDINSNNIIFDREFLPYFIDVDSWQVGKLNNDGYAYFYAQYIFNRNMSFMKLNEDTDRLCLMLLSLIMPFENRCLDDISTDEFDEKCEDIEGLSALHDYFIMLKEENERMPEVPYVGDVLEKSLKI